MVSSRDTNSKMVRSFIYFPLIARNSRFKRDISESEETDELFFTTAQLISNISVEERGNFTEEVLGNFTEEVVGNFTEDVFGNITTEVPLDITTTTEEPLNLQPIVTVVKQIVTQEHPTYNSLYSENMAKEATFLGMVRDG